VAWTNIPGMKWKSPAAAGNFFQTNIKFSDYAVGETPV